MTVAVPAGAVLPDPVAGDAFGLAEQRLLAQGGDLAALQRTDVATAHALLEQLAAGGDDLDATIALAQVASRAQAERLGLRWSEPLVGPPGAPSVAVHALLARFGAPADAVQLARIAALDDLGEPLRTALAETVGAFLAFDEATALAFRDPGQPRLDGLFPARHALLRATAGLAAAAEAAPPLPWGPRAQGSVLVPGVLALDLDRVDDVWTRDVRLSIDLGGNDRYYNNAGGSVVDTLCRSDAPPGGAAAAIDVAGDDEYFGSACGDLGGGYRGAGYLVDVIGNDLYHSGSSSYAVTGGAFLGVGFLLDGAGDDAYGGVALAANGAAFQGAGFLLDRWGRDRYEGYILANGVGFYGSGYLLDGEGSDTYAVVGLGNGGCSGFPTSTPYQPQTGSGFLLDATGDDRYSGLYGANGAAYFRCRALLVDGAGNDRYEGLPGSSILNGGAIASGVGTLLDLGGEDAYLAGSGAVNGGTFAVGVEPGGLGLLLDAAGTDVYRDADGGSGTDKTVVPKGTVGAQVDLPLDPPSRFNLTCSHAAVTLRPTSADPTAILDAQVQPCLAME